MYLAGEHKDVVKEIVESDIPDFADIKAGYRANILEAYKVGITNGMDSSRTFNPKGELTRGQICTLFYNLGWTSPIEKEIKECVNENCPMNGECAMNGECENMQDCSDCKSVEDCLNCENNESCEFCVDIVDVATDKIDVAGSNK